jgi:hypothetical protein
VDSETRAGGGKEYKEREREREEKYLEEGSGAVGDHAVALHLSEAEAAVAHAALHRLPHEDLRRPARPAISQHLKLVQAQVHGMEEEEEEVPAVDLIVDEVLEALVVRGAEEDLRVHAAARVAVVEHFVAAKLVTHPVAPVSATDRYSMNGRSDHTQSLDFIGKKHMCVF